MNRRELLRSPGFAGRFAITCAAAAKLPATHLTSVADEFGRLRKNYGLAELLHATSLDRERGEIPDLNLKLRTGEVIPQDPQGLRFRPADTEVLAETLDCGHRAKLGPAIVQCSGGKGAVIYIGSSVGAVYEEARMKPMRVLFHTLGAPWLAPQRSYEMDYLPGVTPHVVASHDTLLLHLLPDTGN